MGGGTCKKMLVSEMKIKVNFHFAFLSTLRIFVL